MSRRHTLEDLCRLPLPGMDYPAEALFVPGREAVTYLQSVDGSLVRSLWHHDLVSGERHVIVGPIPGTESEESIDVQERLRRERTRTSALGVTAHAWATAAAVPTLIVPLAGHLLVGRGEEAQRGIRQLPEIERATDAALSPNGEWVAYVVDGDAWAAPLDGRPPTRLTRDAQPGVSSGMADFVGAEELDRQEGLWWGADSQTIAFARVDERGIPPLEFAPAGTESPQPEMNRYPFAGGPNANVELWITRVDGGSARRVDLGMAPDDYLARVVTNPRGGWLAAALRRDQVSLTWHGVAADGSAEVLWREEAEHWINLDDDTRILADGRILRSSERSGFRHLELRSAKGDLERVLTCGDWMVTQIVAVATMRREVLFVATRDGVLERHLYAVPIDADQPVAEPARLTAEPGWHEIVASGDGERWIDTWSDLDHAPSVRVSAPHAAPIAIHPSAASAASEQLDPPELVEVVAADGRTALHAAIYRAGRGRPNGALPPGVIWVYGGPHFQYVKLAWEMTVDPLRQFLARCGATVALVDNRGTAHRGVEFETIVDGRLGSAEVSDQAAAVRQLAERGELDAAKVGITGWSYGGFMTILAMVREPDLFRVGVAGAPVTDWAGYDTAYTERYLGTPTDNPNGYRDSTLLSQVGALSGDLLLIHGTLDENVHFRHSERLVEALKAAGRDIELVPLPGQRHQTRGADAIRLREQRTTAFLLGGLGLPLPPQVD